MVKKRRDGRSNRFMKAGPASRLPPVGTIVKGYLMPETSTRTALLRTGLLWKGGELDCKYASGVYDISRQSTPHL
jgi:hypothetical protein